MLSENNSLSHHRAASLHMLWASFAFALMAAISHWAGESCDWQLVVFARAFVALIFAVAIARMSGVKLVWRGSATLWMRSIAGSTGMICNFYALAHLPVSDTLTLMNTAPIWVTLLLWLVFKQKPSASIVVAVIASVIGIALIQQPHFEGGKFACLMALCGAFCTSIAMLGLSQLQHLDPRAIVTHFSAVASLFTLVFMFVTRATPTVKHSSVWLLLILVGAAGVAGQIGMTRAFAQGHASLISVIALSQILFGLIFDVLFWQRTINGVSWLGMLLVILPAGWLILSRTPQESHDLIEAEMED